MSHLFIRAKFVSLKTGFLVWWNTSIHFQDIQFEITTEHHTQTQDVYDSTIKTAFLKRSDHWAKGIYDLINQ
jgi:hypothetical protein